MSVRLLSFELVLNEVGQLITCGIIILGYNLHFKELRKLMKNKPQEIKESKVLQELQKQKEIVFSVDFFGFSGHFCFCVSLIKIKGGRNSLIYLGS